ncbi:carbohydrate ABC transporter permease [Cupriavidus basilensis]|uniref:Carbohydrate ABC transporter permease n=1 Tax=Cupriavidus basilensis TaxID=68895 RepID=A0A643FYM3_9BURK|nr:carbohydrate ABC transporter permease [Cupriavidus basilensis]QOT82115.1 carbohydrate ABC transporter permease [Cupriavidus basilensis]
MELNQSLRQKSVTGAVSAPRFNIARITAVAGRWILYAAIVLVFAGPFWAMLATAFSAETVQPGRMVAWPSHPSLKHLVYAWDNAGAWRYLLNSCVVVAGGLVLQMSVSALAAYALARKKFVGAGLVSLLFLSTMMLPEEVIAIPLYLVLGKLPVLHASLLNSYLGMILPVAGWAFSIFVLTEFMKAIPMELEEAARIDGASEWQIFWRVVLPLVKPALGTTGIFGFLMIWDQYLLPLIVVNRESLYTLPVILATLRTDEHISPNVFIAVTLLAMIPSVLLYLGLQKQFQRGLTAGAVKG